MAFCLARSALDPHLLCFAIHRNGSNEPDLQRDRILEL